MNAINAETTTCIIDTDIHISLNKRAPARGLTHRLDVIEVKEYSDISVGRPKLSRCGIATGWGSD